MRESHINDIRRNSSLRIVCKENTLNSMKSKRVVLPLPLSDDDDDRAEPLLLRLNMTLLALLTNHCLLLRESKRDHCCFRIAVITSREFSFSSCSLYVVRSLSLSSVSTDIRLILSSLYVFAFERLDSRLATSKL
jgi:hypothetical protein